MRIINYIAQIIASIAYSGLYGSLTVIISLAPLFLIGRLSMFWIFVIWFFAFDIVMGLQVFARSIITLPYAWINRNNIIAKIISSLTVLATGIVGGVKCWTMVDDMPVALIILCVLITIQLAIDIIGTITALCSIDGDL